MPDFILKDINKENEILKEKKRIQCTCTLKILSNNLALNPMENK